MDFDTEFDGMRFRALAGLRYERSNITANSLQKIQRRSSGTTRPSSSKPTLPNNATYSEVHAAYDEFLPSLDTSLQYCRTCCCALPTARRSPVQTSPR